jgi:hypothetical protein
LAGAAEMLWPTPMAGTVAQNGNSAAGNSDFSRKAEDLAKALWGTPRASDADKGGPNQSFGAGGTPLPAQAANWPTPASRDHKGENSAAHLTNGTGRLHMDQLPNAVAFLFTRPAPETPTHGLPSSDPRLTWRRLRRLVISTHGRGVWKRMAANGGKRRLNPNFVEWLMGWPTGHSLCDCSGMRSFHCKRPWHGSHFPEHTGLGGLSGKVPEMRSSNHSEQEAKHGRQTEGKILQRGMRDQRPEATAAVLPDVRGNHSQAAPWAEHEVLQHKMQRGIPEKRTTATLSQQESKRPVVSGTQVDYGPALGQAASNNRACSPQERHQDRQPDRKSRDHGPIRPREIPSPALAAVDDGLRDLRHDIHTPQNQTRQNEHMLASLSGCVCSQPPMGFLIWQQRMRGALLRLPMASGPWIWKPPADVTAPQQMTLI